MIRNKGKKGVSMLLILAMTMALIMPSYTVQASGIQGENETEDTLTNIENRDTTENSEGVSDVSDEKLSYVYIESPYVQTPGTQNIAVSFSEETKIETAILTYVNETTGEQKQTEASDMKDNLALFQISYENDNQTGVYKLLDIIITVDGKGHNFTLSDYDVESRYGVNTECTTNPDDVIEKEDAQEAPEAEVSVMSMDESGNVEEEESINDAIEAAVDNKTEAVSAFSENSGISTYAASAPIIVVLDPGHDNNHAGARGNGLAEEQITLKLAKYCKSQLETYSGIKVYMTRTAGECPSANGNVAGHRENNESVCLENRAVFAKNKGASVFVSFHLNSFSSSSAKGAEVYYASGSNSGAQNNSIDMAKKIASELKKLGLTLRNNQYGINTANFSVLRNSISRGIPAVLIEHCFISNPNEASKYLSTESGLRGLGVADAVGIINYLGLNNGQWKQDDKGYWFQYNNGTYPKNCWAFLNGYWYHFDKEGYRQTSWITDAAKQYYLDDSGRMVTGWKNIENIWYYFDTSGTMQKGWRHEESTWYYLKSDGKMATSWANIDGYRYYFNGSGVMQKTWLLSGGAWYYLNPKATSGGPEGSMQKGWLNVGSQRFYLNPDTGKMVTGTTTIDGIKYTFNSSGVLQKTQQNGLVNVSGKYYYYINGRKQTGWHWIKTAWYYFNSSGVMATDWLNTGGAWYYMNTDGKMATKWKTVGTYKYYFNSSGVMQKGWAFLGNAWYYLNPKSMSSGPEGSMQKGWLTIGKTKYYLNPDTGKMATGTISIGGVKYTFNSSGVLQKTQQNGLINVSGKYYYYINGRKQTGWHWIKTAWYYFNSSGVMATDWLNTGGEWYYMNSDGKMATKWKTVGGYKYYFNTSGVMQKGWAFLGNAWFYLNPKSTSSGPEGSMQKGWLTIGSTKYYLNPDTGKMATGTVTISGKQYKFNSSGVLISTKQSGFQQSGGNYYYYENGVKKTGWLWIQDAWYYFNSTGVMMVGWQNLGGIWYYLKSDGKMSTGWLTTGGQKYYFESNGAMVVGYKKISSVWYYFNKNLSPEGALSYTGVTPIMGGSALGKTKADVVAKFVSMYKKSKITYPASDLKKGGAATIQDFCGILYNEAITEGVKPEVVFAQSMNETGYLKFGGDVKISQYNFAGLGATGNGVSGNSFKDVQEGLRAQVQHLKAYASNEALKNTCVDTRFKYVTRNSAPYVEWLGIQENPNRIGWAAANKYGINLMNLYIKPIYSL